MRSPFKTLALSALAALALGSAAQAADVTVTVRGDAHVRVADHRGFEERRYGHGRGYDDDGFRSFPERRWNRVVETRGGWDHGRWSHGGFGRGDCRVIIRRRVNPWGDVVVKKTRICD